MNFPYEDIVSLPHPVSSRHSRMTNADRAAQFSSFAALSGHQDAIAETARLTDHRAELAEDEKAVLNAKFQALSRRLPERPPITLTYFAQDPLKEGGAYVTVTGRVKKLDLDGQTITLENGERFTFGDIFAVV